MDQATFVENWRTLALQQRRSAVDRFPNVQWDLLPMLQDDTRRTGFDHHYIYHTAWAMREMLKISPSFHVDFGSSLYFVAMASAVIPIHFYDFRPPALVLANVRVRRGDLTALDIHSASLPSVSCLHVMEHVGLGRYGDTLNFDGDLVAMKELGRIVASGGSLLFAVPVGQARIVYNAHRIYSYQQIVDAFADRFDLIEFSLVLDGGSMLSGATKELADAQSYGCGCFHFKARQ